MIDPMPKANLRVLESSRGPFHKGECSVCGEKFEVPLNVQFFKTDLLEQFHLHLRTTHPRQLEAKKKRKCRDKSG
jgi:hypothetical protein